MRGRGPDFDIGANVDLRMYAQKREMTAAQVGEVVFDAAAHNRIAAQGASNAGGRGPQVR